MRILGSVAIKTGGLYLYIMGNVGRYET
jgi:hypothetical protein